MSARSVSQANSPPFGGAILLLILLIQAGLVQTYSQLTPIGEGPDELSHLAYSRNLLEQGRLPVAGDRETSLTQAEHPPLYYALGALLGAGGSLDRLNPPINPFFSANLLNPHPIPNIHLHPPAGAPRVPGTDTALRMRMLSLLCGLAVTTATWRIVLLLLPGESAVALAAAALIAFWPGFAFATAVFSNDMGANAASAWVLAGAARLVSSRGRGPFTLPLVGLALGLALLSKLTTLAMVPILGIAWLLERRRSPSQTRWAPDLLALVGPVILVFGWWPLRNMALYGLDQPLAWRRFAVLAEPMLRTVPLRSELPTYFWVQFSTLVGRFGWVSVPQPSRMYQTVGVALGAILSVGLLTAARRGQGAHQDPLLSAGRPTLVLLICAFAPIYGSILQLGTRLNLVAAHARYVFSGLPLLAAILALCWALCWPPRLRAAALVSLSVVVLAWSVWVAAAVLGPAYTMPTPAPALPAEVAELQARFDPGIALRAITLADEIVPPGRPARIWLRLSALGDLSTPPAADEPGLVLFVQLIGPADRKAGQTDGPPFAGRFPFEAWPVGANFLVPIDLPVAADAPTGPVDLLVGIYRDGTPESRMAAFDRAGNPLSQNAWRMAGALFIQPASGPTGPPTGPQTRP